MLGSSELNQHFSRIIPDTYANSIDRKISDAGYQSSYTSNSECDLISLDSDMQSFNYPINPSSDDTANNEPTNLSKQCVQVENNYGNNSLQNRYQTEKFDIQPQYKNTPFSASTFKYNKNSKNYDNQDMYQCNEIPVQNTHTSLKKELNKYAKCNEIFNNQVPDTNWNTNTDWNRNEVGWSTCDNMHTNRNFSSASNQKSYPIRRQHSDGFIKQHNRNTSTNFVNFYPSQNANTPDITATHLDDSGFMNPLLQSLPGNSSALLPQTCDQPQLEQSSSFAGRQFCQERSGDNGGLASINLSSNKVSISSQSRYTTEDEAWRSYLENPLTAATTAMMSIQGDEDSAAALGILYDYYKVPREKRILSYQSNLPSHEAGSPPHFIRMSSAMSDADAAINNRIPSEDSAILSPLSSNVRTRELSESMARSRCNSEIKPPNTLRLFPSDDIITLSTVRNQERPNDIEVSSAEYMTKDRNVVDHLTPERVFPDPKDSSPQQGPTYGDEYNYHFQTLATPTIKDQQMQSVSPHSHNSNNNSVTSVASDFSNSSYTNVFSGPGQGFPNNYTGEFFEYVMEAPKSLKQKEGEPTMSYINKGLFYCVSLRECSGQQQRFKNLNVTSVVQIIFGDAKPEEEQLKHWRYWHARQHTAKQRIIDIADYKESCMISSIDEFAHNAISFKWNVNEIAKIFISCNCLSTDFSAQKGIKGLPLLLQIDTYVNGRPISGSPDHRGLCQLKVFCDKGAERKIRDEERKAMRKKQKSSSKLGLSGLNLSPIDIKPALCSPSTTPPLQSSASSNSNAVANKRQDVVYLKTVTNCMNSSVYFVPEVTGHSSSTRNHLAISPSANRHSSTSGIIGNNVVSATSDIDHVFLSNQAEFENAKLSAKRSHSCDDSEIQFTKSRRVSEESHKVLLYIRKESEDVYDGVMLREATLKGLKLAIEDKYEIRAGNIYKILKKSKKGILVNVDDNIIRHYSNEDTFVIQFLTEIVEKETMHKIILNSV